MFEKEKTASSTTFTKSTHPLNVFKPTLTLTTQPKTGCGWRLAGYSFTSHPVNQ